MEHLCHLLDEMAIPLEDDKKRLLLAKIKGYQETHKSSEMRDFVLQCRDFYQNHSGLNQDVFNQLLNEVKDGSDPD